MKEWHPLKNVGLGPNNLLPGSGKKAWWRCKDGHEWQSVIGQRAKLGIGCRNCADNLRRLAKKMDDS